MYVPIGLRTNNLRARALEDITHDKQSYAIIKSAETASLEKSSFCTYNFSWKILLNLSIPIIVHSIFTSQVRAFYFFLPSGLVLRIIFLVSTAHSKDMTSQFQPYHFYQGYDIHDKAYSS
jgi:hypothetical protein